MTASEEHKRMHALSLQHNAMSSLRQCHSDVPMLQLGKTFEKGKEKKKHMNLTLTGKDIDHARLRSTRVKEMYIYSKHGIMVFAGTDRMWSATDS
jgi:hypothetical protein